MAFGVLDGTGHGADGNGDDKASGHSDEQIADALRQAESGTSVNDICRLPSRVYVVRQAFRSTWTWSAVALEIPPDVTSGLVY